MKKRGFKTILFIALILIAIVLTACSNEADELRAQIDILQNDNTELQSTTSTLQTENEQLRYILEQTALERDQLRYQLEAAEEAARQEPEDPVGPLAITYAGVPNADMSWPLRNGNLKLGLRVDLSNFDAGVEIVWRSANEEIFSVSPDEDGTSAIATPYAVGSAQVIVTIGDQETRSWVRIT